MKAVVKELRGGFPTLLRSNRGGVISAALAAAARTGTGQLELSKALSAALRELPGNQQACHSLAHLKYLDCAPFNISHHGTDYVLLAKYSQGRQLSTFQQFLHLY